MFLASLNAASLNIATMSVTALANQACCQVCKRILVGTWTPWRIPTSADGRWGIYEFHTTLQDLRDCVRNESCPICKIALSRGNWASYSPLTETTFACMPDETYVSINITPNGGTSEPRGCCFVTLRKGITPRFTICPRTLSLHRLSMLTVLSQQHNHHFRGSLCHVL
jgi:hypothetical protein